MQTFTAVFIAVVAERGFVNIIHLCNSLIAIYTFMESFVIW